MGTILGLERLGLDPVRDKINLIVAGDDSVRAQGVLAGAIDAAALAKMKKGVRIINCARGGIINEKDLVEALKTGKVDAYFGDAPVVAYYIEKDPKSFEIGGTPINPISIGMAIRKSDTELQAAVRQGVKAIYADGTMDTILTRWKLGKAVAKLQP